MNPVAKTIFQQLGANRFSIMTGAKDFVGGNNYLQFSLPANSNGIKCNNVKIELTPDDLYKVTFSKVTSPTMKQMMSGTSGVTVKVLKSVDDVYAEDLQDIFTDVTGLYTSL